MVQAFEAYLAYLWARFSPQHMRLAIAHQDLLTPVSWVSWSTDNLRDRSF
jgi:hypothetical protein